MSSRNKNKQMGPGWSAMSASARTRDIGERASKQHRFRRGLIGLAVVAVGTIVVAEVGGLFGASDDPHGSSAKSPRPSSSSEKPPVGHLMVKGCRIDVPNKGVFAGLDKLHFPETAGHIVDGGVHVIDHASQFRLVQADGKHTFTGDIDNVPHGVKIEAAPYRPDLCKQIGGTGIPSVVEYYHIP